MEEGCNAIIIVILVSQGSSEAFISQVPLNASNYDFVDGFSLL